MNLVIVEIFKTTQKLLKKHISLYAVIFVFFVSRIINFFYFGVRFDPIPLGYYYQFINPDLLKNNLLQSVYYLHSQPPLFNIFSGIILKLFPENYSVAFGLVYMGVGAIFSVTLFLVMAELGIRLRLSAMLTCLFTVSPLVVDYENWLFYEYPTAALLSGAVLFLWRFVVRQKTSDCFIFFLILALITYLRGLLNLYWFLSVLILLLVFRLKLWKKIIKGCAVPLILIFGLYLKHYVLFGTFSISDAQIGAALAETLTGSLPNDVLDNLIKQKKISGLSRVKYYCPDFSQYIHYGIYPKKTGIPVLDEIEKPTGVVNPHNLIHLAVGRRKIKDAVYVLLHYPKLVLCKRAQLLIENYFLTSDQCIPYVQNRSPRWEKWREFHKRFFLGATVNGESAFLSAGLSFLFLYGFFLIFRSFNIRRASGSLGVVIAFMMITIFFLIFATLFMWGDWSRYRFLIDSFYLILFGLFLQDALRVSAHLCRKCGGKC